MKWLGIGIACLGGLLFLSALSLQQTLEAQSTLCQLVEGERLLGSPVRLLLDPDVTFVKGTGPQGSKFLAAAGGPYRSYDAMVSVFGMTKICSIIMVALGIVGYQFEKWRQRTGAILTGKSPDL